MTRGLHPQTPDASAHSCFGQSPKGRAVFDMSSVLACRAPMCLAETGGPLWIRHLKKDAA